MQRKKIVHLALSGASGRMGKAVKQVIKEKNSKFILSVEIPPMEKLQKCANKKIDGVVDFSVPELFSVTLKWCVKNKKPFVSGTTALSATQKRSLKTAARHIPVFYEENMSWGIWFIKQALKNFSEDSINLLLEDIHHKNKKDKPSGTALKLKNNLPLFAQKKLQIDSIRKGRVFGTHRFYFKGLEEQVLFEHKALDRKLFARGSLKALRWLINQTPGLYSYDDMYIT